jgi:hypothetical protein
LVAGDRSESRLRDDQPCVEFTRWVAGGLIYAYDPSGSGLHVYKLNGTAVQTLPAGSGHWSSPIIASGIIALLEGSANTRLTGGVLDLYHWQRVEQPVRAAGLSRRGMRASPDRGP